MANDRIDFIIAFENGEATDEETIENFQKMIDDGSVWGLQGFYGRTAQALIDSGKCHWPEKQTYDYYGNKLPTSKAGGSK